MNLKSKMRGYIDGADVMMGLAIFLAMGALALLLVSVIVEGSRPLKANTVAVETVECDPVTVDSVPPYTCVITVKAPDQFLRDTFEANGYVQSLEYGQHKVDDPYPTHPEEEVDEAEDEASGVGVTITFVKEESE